MSDSPSADDIRDFLGRSRRPGTTPVTLPVPVGLLAEVDQIAREAGVDNADVMLEAIEAYVDGVREARRLDLDS